MRRSDTSAEPDNATTEVCEYDVDLRRRQHWVQCTLVSNSLPTRVPRVARLMALSIRMAGLVRDEPSLSIGGYAKLASLGHVTRARITQIMNLRYLAPDIQEAILHLPAVECPAGLRQRKRTARGRSHERITERDVRPIAAVNCWNRQRRMWKGLCKRRKVNVP